jgi:RNA polymerase sigma-70 factor, ECF subfamily
MKALVKRLQAKQLDAFEEFYDLTHKQVFFTLKKYLKDAMLIEDLMQDVYMKFIDKIDIIDTERNIQAYLNTMARNSALDVLRKTSHLSYDDQVIYEVIDEEQVEEDYMWLLDHLKSNQKEIMYLHIVEEMTFKAIAEVLEMPLGTVQWHYHEALKILRKVYKQHET